MATKYGVEATKRLNTVPVGKNLAKYQHGRLRVAYDEYEISADLASADKIVMGRLPKGAKVMGFKLAFDDLDGSGGTLDIGVQAADSASSFTALPEALASNIDVTSAGIVVDDDAAIVGEIAGASGFGYEATEDLDIIITTDGDTDATSGTIKLAVHYTLD